jgi:hypothetical protein
MKTFRQMYNETMTTGSGIAGLPPDQPPGPPEKKKKRKTKILTRNYIEVAGQRKRIIP